jgi:hypothetical protein
MQSSRGLLAMFALGATFGLTACDDILSPCPDQSAKQTTFIDGVWAITAVNGSSIPSSGFSVGSGDFLKAGSIEFNTREVIGGCKEPERMEGVTVARYAIVDASGKPKPSLAYTGTFIYDPISRAVLIKSPRGSLDGLKDGNELAVKGLSPKTWNPTTITFTR